jgi:hypothetical protein
MERLTDADLGSPGPLVHTLERMHGHYERELIESIKRKPSSLAVWMVNRILNATHVIEQRKFYVSLLQLSSEHQAATQAIQSEAQHFLKRQKGIT